jgi:protein tyrosine phosphatase (PTP) superfamily phosphohydrolase (DUF442 family)
MRNSRDDRILNFRRITDLIGTAGQPTAEQFADIKASGYEVVINLAMTDSTNAVPNEAELVVGQGLEYVHIPVVWEKPTSQDLERFFGAMARYQGRRVFIHCAMNWRVSAFVFLHRVIVQHEPKETARETLEDVWQPNATWAGFIAQALEDQKVQD